MENTHKRKNPMHGFKKHLFATKLAFIPCFHTLFGSTPCEHIQFEKGAKIVKGTVCGADQEDDRSYDKIPSSARDGKGFVFLSRPLATALF